MAVESPSNQRRIAVLEQDWQDGRLLKKLDENRLLWFVHLPLAYLSHGFIRQLAGGDWRLALFVTMLLVGVAYVLRLPQLFVTLVRRGYLRFLLRRGESL